MNETPPRSLDEHFDPILLHLMQSVEGRGLWSPYRVLLQLLIACIQDLKLAFGQLAAHLREAGNTVANQATIEAANEDEPETDPASQPSLPDRELSARPQAAAEQSAARPRRTRPEASPQAEELPLPLWGCAAKQTNAGARGRAARNSEQAAPLIQPSPARGEGLRMAGQRRFSTLAKPAPWHAHIVTISKH